MVIQGIIIATLAPPTSGDGFNPSTAEVVQVGPDIQVVARDQGGDTVAVLASWVEPDGTIHVSADYGNGWHETVIDGDDMTSEVGGELSPKELEHRADTIAALVYDSASLHERGWVDCGWAVAGAAAGCAAANPAFCIGGSIVAACTCLPEIVDEFEDIECPGF